MLCYRCGSYNPDGTRKCDICGQSFADRRTTGRSPSLVVAGSPKHIAPYEPGSLIAGRYRVAEPIAQGSAGWVLRARDEEVDLDVAVKVIAAQFLQTEEDRDRFVKVVKRAQRVQHPNVARIYDHGEDGPYVFYTLPFLEGLTLRKIIDLRTEKSQVFAFEETFPLLIQLATAVDNLEKFGPHGALRPTNVVVLPDIVKVTGLPHFSGLPQRPFVAAQSGGAGSYLAPEARREAAAVDRRADVYSLAVIAAEMLTGSLPDKGPVAWSEVTRALPPAVVSVLQHGLQESPDARPTTAERFFKALVDAAEGVPSEHTDAEGTVTPIAPPPPELHEPTVVSEEPTSPAGRPTKSSSSPPPPPSPPSSPDLAGPTEVRAPLVALDTPVPLTRRRTTQQVHRPKSALKTPAPQRGRGALVLGVAILLAGISVSAAIWFQRNRGTPIKLTPVQAAEQDGPDEPLPKPPEPAPSGATGPAPLPAPETPKPAPEALAPGKPKDEPKPEAKPEPKPEPVAVRPEPKDGGRDGGKDTNKDKDLRKSGKEPERSPELDRAIKTAALVPEPPDAPPTPPEPPKSKEVGCPEGTVKIDAGSFTMGTPTSDPLRGFGDLPARKRDVDAFCIDVYEYPNQAGKKPLSGVSWAQAKGYCERRGRRLCSEAEWERACKGPSNQRFPTGSDFGGGCNAGGDGRRPGLSGSYPACKSGFGVFDLAGNVGEWTSGRWSPDIADKVVKGGAADQATYTARCSARANEGATAKSASLGFRCCKSLE